MGFPQVLGKAFWHISSDLGGYHAAQFGARVCAIEIAESEYVRCCNESHS